MQNSIDFLPENLLQDCQKFPFRNKIIKQFSRVCLKCLDIYRSNPKIWDSQIEGVGQNCIGKGATVKHIIYDIYV